MITLAKLWPRAQVRELQQENKELKDILKVAQDDVGRMRVQLSSAVADAVEARKENALTLKKMVNFQMLAAGSKVVMFEEVGPHLPPKSAPVEIDNQSTGRVKAGTLARQGRANFLADFIKSQSASEPLPYEDSEVETDKAANE